MMITKASLNAFIFLNKYFWFVSKRSMQDPVPLKQVVVFRSSHRKCSVRKGFLRNFAKFTCARVSLSCEFCEIFEHLFTEQLWRTASMFRSNWSSYRQKWDVIGRREGWGVSESSGRLSFIFFIKEKLDLHYDQTSCWAKC